MLETPCSSKKLTAPQVKAVTDIWGEIGEWTHSRLSGFSMWPLIKPGDTVIIDHRIKNYKLGEIVVFQYRGRLIAHRVVKLIKEKSSEIIYLTKGDHNRYLDQSILSMKDIVGNVVKINGSNVTIDCSTFLWRTLNYLIAVYSLAVGSFFNNFREI